MSVETISLPERCGVDAAHEALNLAVALDDGETFTLDAAETNDIHGAAVVAFANIARKLAERGAPLKILAPSDDFIAAFTDLGLYGDLMKMEFVK